LSSPPIIVRAPTRMVTVRVAAPGPGRCQHPRCSRWERLESTPCRSGRRGTVSGPEPRGIAARPPSRPGGGSFRSRKQRVVRDPFPAVGHGRPQSQERKTEHRFRPREAVGLRFRAFSPGPGKSSDLVEANAPIRCRRQGAGAGRGLGPGVWLWIQASSAGALVRPESAARRNVRGGVDRTEPGSTADLDQRTAHRGGSWGSHTSERQGPPVFRGPRDDFHPSDPGRRKMKKTDSYDFSGKNGRACSAGEHF